MDASRYPMNQLLPCQFAQENVHYIKDAFVI